MLVKYLRHELPSLYAIIRARKGSEGALKNKLRRSLNLFLAQTPWPTLPQGEQLILIADAFIKQIEGRWHTAYIMILREVRGKDAVIAPPYVREGTETVDGWDKALETLPKSVKCRIQALVCDGHVGLVWYARWHNWLLQRCHFHLIARLQSRRSKWKQSRHREEGARIYAAVMRALTAPESAPIIPLLTEIENLAWDTTSPEIRGVLLGFVNNHADYRTYLRNPELHLPTTNNSAESLISMIKNIMHRARGFRTRTSLEKWIGAFIKEKKTIRCNGNSPPN